MKMEGGLQETAKIALALPTGYPAANRGPKVCDCESGWLPTGGDRDVVPKDCAYCKDADLPHGTLLLWPTEFTVCFHCNIESWSNEDLECVV